MNYKIIILFIFITLCVYGSVNSQPVIDNMFKIGGGVSLPVENDGIYNRDAGYHINIGAGFLMTRHAGIKFDLDYDLFRDPKDLYGNTVSDNPRFYMTSLELCAMAGLFNRKTKFKPYAYAGLGLHYLTKLKTDSEDLLPSAFNLSAIIGAGVLFTFVREGGLYLETEYQKFISSNRLTANIPVRGGLVYCP